MEITAEDLYAIIGELEVQRRVLGRELANAVSGGPQADSGDLPLDQAEEGPESGEAVVPQGA